MPYWTSSTLPYSWKPSAQNSSPVALTSSVSATTSPLRAKSASLPGWGKNEMSGGLPPSTWVLMFASQSASPVYSMSRLTVSPHAWSVSLMDAIDGSSRSGPVSVTLSPPKSSSPLGASVSSPPDSLPESLSSSLPQDAATSDRAIGTAASLYQRLFMWVLPLIVEFSPNGFDTVNAYRPGRQRQGQTSRSSVATHPTGPPEPGGRRTRRPPGAVPSPAVPPSVDPGRRVRAPPRGGRTA